MRDMLQNGLAWLRAQRKAHASRTVTYRRGEDSVQLSATVGMTVLRLEDDYGIEQRLTRRDYLIEVADLVLAGQQVEPQAGDRIEEADGETTWVYEVMGPGGGEPDWRYSDPYRRVYRIHTKHVETQEA